MGLWTSCKERCKVCRRDMDGGTWQSAKNCLQRFGTRFDRLANRRAVTFFAIFEFLVTGWLLGYCMIFEGVTLVSTDFWASLHQFLAMPARWVIILLVVRMECAIFGALAAWFRFVKRTRLYWFLIYVNVVTTLPWFVPITRQQCRCDFDRAGYEVDVAQCRALRSFLWLVGEEAPSVVPTGLDAAPWSLDSQAAQDVQAEHVMVEQPPVLLERLLERFSVVPAGASFEYGQDDALDLNGRCEEPYSLGGDLDFRVLLQRLQCGADVVRASNTMLAARNRLTEALRKCLSTELCGVVDFAVSGSQTLRTCGLLSNATVPRLSQSALEAARRCSRVAWDCSEDPSAIEDCSEFSVFLVRHQEPPNVEDVSLPTEAMCTLISSLTMLWVLALTFGTVPMLVATYKYWKSGCLDDSEVARALVRPDSKHSHRESDQFEVGTWISLEPKADQSQRFAMDPSETIRDFEADEVDTSSADRRSATAAAADANASPRESRMRQVTTNDESFASFEFSVRSESVVPGDFGDREVARKAHSLDSFASFQMTTSSAGARPSSKGAVELQAVTRLPS